MVIASSYLLYANTIKIYFGVLGLFIKDEGILEINKTDYIRQ